ncbi:uncharacterized protein LOC144750107 [Ciona intestinalis]
MASASSSTAQYSKDINVQEELNESFLDDLFADSLTGSTRYKDFTCKNIRTYALSSDPADIEPTDFGKNSNSFCKRVCEKELSNDGERIISNIMAEFAMSGFKNRDKVIAKFPQPCNNACSLFKSENKNSIAAHNLLKILKEIMQYKPPVVNPDGCESIETEITPYVFSTIEHLGGYTIKKALSDERRGSLIDMMEKVPGLLKCPSADYLYVLQQIYVLAVKETHKNPREIDFNAVFHKIKYLSIICWIYMVIGMKRRS